MHEMTVQVSEHHFDITLHDESRSYHFNDELLGADPWVSALNNFLVAWENYLKHQQANRGGGYNGPWKLKS